MIEFVYSGKCAKLSSVILRDYPAINYNSVRKLFRKGDIRVNGQKIYSDVTVTDEDSIRLYYEISNELKIVYENDDIAVFLNL